MEARERPRLPRPPPPIPHPTPSLGLHRGAGPLRRDDVGWAGSPRYRRTSHRDGKGLEATRTLGEERNRIAAPGDAQQVSLNRSLATGFLVKGPALPRSEGLISTKRARRLLRRNLATPEMLSQASRAQKKGQCMHASGSSKKVIRTTRTQEDCQKMWQKKLLSL